MLIVQTTYVALLVVQALHLFHHRISKRHISFAEVISAGGNVRAALDNFRARVATDGHPSHFNNRAGGREPVDQEALAKLGKRQINSKVDEGFYKCLN